MSKDDIIKSWKGEKDPPRREPTPPSPVGDSELPDEELERVAGGGFNCTTPPECPDTTFPAPPDGVA